MKINVFDEHVAETNATAICHRNIVPNKNTENKIFLRACNRNQCHSNMFIKQIDFHNVLLTFRSSCPTSCATSVQPIPPPEKKTGRNVQQHVFFGRVRWTEVGHEDGREAR